MFKHQSLTILEDHLDINFAADLMSQFDLKHQQLYSPNNPTPRRNNLDPRVISKQHNYNSLCNDGWHDLEAILEKKDQITNLNYSYRMALEETTANSASLLSICVRSHTERITEDGYAAEPKGTQVTRFETTTHLSNSPLPTNALSNSSAPLPPTIHRNQHSLLRRSSGHLNQKFIADGINASPRPHSTIINKENTISSDSSTVRPATMRTNGHRTIESNLSFPCSATPSPPAFNASPLPCSYPPTPLHYSPVDPPSDCHRASFPWRKKSCTNDTPRRQSEPILSRYRIKGRRSFIF